MIRRGPARLINSGKMEKPVGAGGGGWGEGGGRDVLVLLVRQFIANCYCVINH